MNFRIHAGRSDTIRLVYKVLFIQKMLSVIGRLEEFYGSLSTSGLIILLSLLWQTSAHQVLHCKAE